MTFHPPRLWLLVFCVGAGPLRVEAEETLDFNRDIRPILADKCFHCHGPDSVTREAGLRLDQKEGLLAVAPAVNGGSSELVSRVSHQDPDLKMPPPDSGRTLSQTEIDILTRWVGEGAPWQKHWSFIPPKTSPLPEVKRTDWVRNPIDHHVLAGLEAVGLQPSPEAS